MQAVELSRAGVPRPQGTAHPDAAERLYRDHSERVIEEGRVTLPDSEHTAAGHATHLNIAGPSPAGDRFVVSRADGWRFVVDIASGKVQRLLWPSACERVTLRLHGHMLHGLKDDSVVRWSLP